MFSDIPQYFYIAFQKYEVCRCQKNGKLFIYKEAIRIIVYPS